MAYHINEKCICCGLCATMCPVECISPGDEQYVIDEKKCTHCGACADVCHKDAPNPME